MTLDDILAQMTAASENTGDVEAAHAKADGLLLELITVLQSHCDDATSQQAELICDRYADVEKYYA